jgi:hypothetical protein
MMCRPGRLRMSTNQAMVGCSVHGMSRACPHLAHPDDPTGEWLVRRHCQVPGYAKIRDAARADLADLWSGIDELLVVFTYGWRMRLVRCPTGQFLGAVPRLWLLRLAVHRGLAEGW